MPDRHADSLYHAELPAEPPREALHGTRETEVCVIGGGLAGLGIACELARAGTGVTVLEAGRIGCGASGRNGGFVSAGYALGIADIARRVGRDHARRLGAISRRGVKLVRERIEAQGARESARPVPGMLVASRHPVGAALEQHLHETADLLGVTREAWSRERVREAVVSERYFEGVYDAEAFHCQPLAVARALATAAEQAGAVLHESTRATVVERRGAGFHVGAANGAVAARHVVCAGSADLGRVEPRLARAVLPVATYMLATEPLGNRLATAIRTTAAIADTRGAGDYYRAVGDRILWGGRMTTRETPPARLAELLRGDLLDVYPQLDGVRVSHAWAGLMGYARHRMPLVGRFADGPWYCTAFGGHGLNTTAACGELVARAIATGDDEWRLFEPFGPAWGGGAVGRVVAQATYWRYQLGDRLRERRARRR